jgi:hypothetical protein
METKRSWKDGFRANWRDQDMLRLAFWWSTICGLLVYWFIGNIINQTAKEVMIDIFMPGICAAIMFGAICCFELSDRIRRYQHPWAIEKFDEDLYAVYHQDSGNVVCFVDRPVAVATCWGWMPLEHGDEEVEKNRSYALTWHMAKHKIVDWVLSNQKIPS